MKTLYHGFDEFKNQLAINPLPPNSKLYVCVPDLHDIRFSDPFWVSYIDQLLDVENIHIHFLWNEPFWQYGKFPRIIQLLQPRGHHAKHYMIPEIYKSRAFFFISSPDFGVQKKGTKIFEFSVMTEPEAEINMLHQFAIELHHECEAAPPFTPLGL